MMAFITGSFGIMQPYTNPYLLAAGLSKWEINLVAGIALLSGMVVQPLIGRLSDAWDARKPLILGAAVVAAIAYSLFPISNSFIVLLMLSILGTNGFTYLNTVSGVIIGRIAGPARSGGAYTRFRVLGSITYIIVAIVCGKLLPNRGTLTAADLQPIFIIGPIIYITIGLLSTRIPDPKKGSIVHDLVTSDDAESADKLSKVQNSQPMPKLIPPFLLAFAFYQGALYGVSANLPIYLTEVLHAKPSDLGVFFAFGVVTEVLVMFQVGKLTDRIGRRPALLLAFCLLPIRLIAYNYAPTPLWAAVDFGLLHALNTCAKALDEPLSLQCAQVVEDGSLAKGIGRDAVKLDQIKTIYVQAFAAGIDVLPHRIQCPVFRPAWRREASLFGRDKDTLRCILSHPACNQALGAAGAVNISGIKKRHTRSISRPKNRQRIHFFNVSPAASNLPATKTHFSNLDAIK